MTSVVNSKGKIVEGAVTGVVAAIFGFLTDRVLIWATDLTLIQTITLGCAAAAVAGAGVLEILARRRSHAVTTTSAVMSNAEVQASSIPVHHDQDGSDPSVRFWHVIADREKHGRDVRALLRSAQHRVIVSGIELLYIVKFCDHALRTALSSGILVGIVISRATPKSIAFYPRYSRGVEKSIGTTHELYTAFANSLEPKQLECFALYHTDIPLTHSIGLYDNSVYVSEFCIDRSSSLVPSFSPPLGSGTHKLFISELKVLLTEGQCKHGHGHERLLRSL